jgi:hypothetical protein
LEEVPLSEIQGRYQPVSPDLYERLLASTAPPAGPCGWLTEAEQAAKDCVSVATLRRRRARGYGPQPVQFGRKFLYRSDASERFLEEQETAAAERRDRPRRRR